MTSRIPASAFTLGAALLLAGCAGSSDQYPSLATRDAERVSVQFTPAAPTEPPTTPAPTRRRIIDAVEAASNAYREFVAVQPAVGRLVRNASAQSSASDVRAQALVALAELTTLRGQTAIALADLDILKIEAETTFAPIDDVQLAQSQVEAWLNEQDVVIASLWNQIGR